MKDYEEKDTAVQEEQAAEQEEKEYVSGIPNSVLLAVLGGKLKPDDSMIGESETLAPSIAAKMSRAFGMDVSSVKVSRSEKMKGTGMKGMAQGNRVILSSDLDLNTLEGQEILGHELSHIHAQAQGIGMGHVGLLQDRALERQADFEGMRAARGLSIWQDTMDMGAGMNYGFGMAGVEGIQPLTGGISASAAAPMQAALFKPWTWFGSKKKPAANNAPANNAGNANVPVVQSGNVEELQAGGEKDSGIAIPAIDSPTLEQVNIWTAQEKYIKEQKASGGKVSKLSLSVLESEQKQKTTKEIYGGGNIDEKIKNFKAGKRALIEGKLQRAEKRLKNNEMNEKLLNRFKKTTMALFEKCGTEDKDSRALYIRYYEMVKRIEAALHKAPEENSASSGQDDLMSEENVPAEEKKEEQELRQEPEVKKQEEKLEEQEEREEERPAEQHEQAEPQQAPAEENVPQEKEDGVDPALLQLAPLAWRQPTIGSGDENQPPELGIHIKQQEKGKASEAGSPNVKSHSFLSLEFSKKSRSRGRVQRYRTVFGFYPVGKLDTIGSTAQGGTKPGQLEDNESHPADVSRSYRISFGQLNKIARRAGKYADGGYNLYSRNCTTFVADMVGEAGLSADTVGNIFNKDEKWDLGVVKTVGSYMLRGVGALFNTDSFSGDMRGRIGKKDIRYGVNRDLVTEEDMRRYDQTRKRGGVEARGYAPSSTGERMRADREHGGLDVNTDTSNIQLKDLVAELKAANVQSEWGALVEKQTAQAGKALDETIANASGPLFRTVEMVRKNAENMLNNKVDSFDRQMMYFMYRESRYSAYSALKNFYELFKSSAPLLADYIADIFGKVRIIDEVVSKSFNTDFTEMNAYGGKSTKTDRALFRIIEGDTALLSDHAAKLAFGSSKEGMEKRERYEALSSNERTDKKNKKLYLLHKNEDYFENMLFDMVDERFESYERNGVQQNDLDEVFISLPKDALTEKQKGERSGVQSAQMDPSTGKFSTFSDAMQSASLRMLFGEEPVMEQMKDGGSLEKWKKSGKLGENEIDETMPDFYHGIHDVMAKLTGDKKESVHMVMHSLAKTMDENATAFDLARKTSNVIESLYITPVMLDAVRQQRNYMKLAMLADYQQKEQRVINKGSEEKYHEMITEFTDPNAPPSVQALIKNVPGEAMIGELKTMAQEILDKKKAISQNNT